MDAADVAHDGLWQRRQIRRNLGIRRPGLLELLITHAERKQRHAVAEPRRLLAKSFGSHEDEIDFAAQLFLGGGDSPGPVRARGGLVDAVVDRRCWAGGTRDSLEDV